MNFPKIFKFKLTVFSQRQNSNIIRKNSQPQNNNQTGSDADLSVTGKVVGTKSRSGITRNSPAKNTQLHRATTGTYKVNYFSFLLAIVFDLATG